MNTPLPPHPHLSPAGQALVDYVRDHDFSTYADLEQVLSSFFEVEGDGGIELVSYYNLALWVGINERFAETVNDALATRLIARQQVGIEVYLPHNKMPDLPLAKGIRSYARPHWLPLAFRHIEILAKEQLAREKEQELLLGLGKRVAAHA